MTSISWPSCLGCWALRCRTICTYKRATVRGPICLQKLVSTSVGIYPQNNAGVRHANGHNLPGPIGQMGSRPPRRQWWGSHLWFLFMAAKPGPRSTHKTERHGGGSSEFVQWHPAFSLSTRHHELVHCAMLWVPPKTKACSCCISTQGTSPCCKRVLAAKGGRKDLCAPYLVLLCCWVFAIGPICTALGGLKGPFSYKFSKNAAKFGFVERGYLRTYLGTSQMVLSETFAYT